MERRIDAQLLAEALLNAPVAWSLFDIDGHGVAGSREYAAVFELSPDDLVGLPFEAMIEPSDRGGTGEVLAQLRSGELAEYVSTQQAPRPGGGDQLVHLTLRALERDGQRVALFSTATPITDAARFDAHRIQKLIENIDDTISLIDEHGTLIETSGRYKPILGYPSGFWADRTIFDLLHPDDSVRVLALREQVLASPGSVVTGEFRVEAADGTFQPVEVHAVNLLHDPDVSGIVITSRNISDRKALMRDLGESRDAALAEAALRTRLIATVSHELRNPLHAMAGLAELLTTSTGLPDDALSLASTLRRQIDGLTTVIDDLLDSSRLGVGAVSLVSQPVLVRSLVDDVVALAGLGARDKPVAVLGHVPDEVPMWVLGDATRIRQVLSNLVGNAVKFTDEGEVLLLVSVVPNGLQFEVRDTGQGIDDAEMSSIFEAFTTASNAGDGSGAGLGLTIVRQLVELMSGTIEADSTLGEGSTFTVVLPAAECEPPPVVAEPSVSPLDIGGQPVLVVDDNAVNQMLAESQLARLGMRAVVVGTGEAAVELLSKGDGPDLVLMDYHLPGIDGLEATRQIRALEARSGRRCVIVGITAAAATADRLACEEAGMDDFLPKPVSLAVLGEALRRWVQHVPAVGELPNTVDTTVLDGLAADLGNAQVVTELVRTFLDELQGRRTALADACARGDVIEAKRAAHTLKSSSFLLGAMELGRACQRMETLQSVDEAQRTSSDILRFATDAARWYQIWLGRQPI
ncbi:MAG TPA: ATP-binding protein [Ilumatobacteraceae bacterium]|nr:ATP-binding protein [Ilumatobacteraceae bacterium]HRB05116.1 ATP-binding protein [Ilumatobacteraceae bacterium]